MRFACACGSMIYDGTDDLPHKARVIPDQRWNSLFDAIDDLIEHHCATSAARAAACTKIRTLVNDATRSAWQCASCGRLHLDDASRRLRSFAPETPDTPRNLFRSRG